MHDTSASTATAQRARRAARIGAVVLAAFLGTLATLLGVAASYLAPDPAALFGGFLATMAGLLTAVALLFLISVWRKS